MRAAISGPAPRFTAAQVLRALRRDGWQEHRQSGSHLVLLHPVKRGQVIVPVHAGKIVKAGTLHSILKTAELNAEQLRELA